MLYARATAFRSVAVFPGARRGTAAATIGFCALLLAACAQTPRAPAGFPLTVELGPVIRLLDAPTSNDQVRAILDDAGRAHVVIAASRAKTLRHLVVDSGSTIALDEVVRTDVSVASLDAAFDAAGGLHVLAGPQHFVRASSGQWAEAATPWAAAGLEATAPRFVAGGDRNRPLLYAFDVRGKAVGAPARWDVYGIGGYGAGIIWPWRTRGSRVAIVAEDGGRYDEWSVVGLDDNEDVADWAAIAEPGGRVHVVYDAQRSVLATQSLARYACIGPAADDSSPVREIGGRRVRAAPGTPIPVTPENPIIGLNAALGFDAATRELLLVRPHASGQAFRDGIWEPIVPMPLELAWSPQVAPRSGRRIDVVVTGNPTDSTIGRHAPVFYLQFREGRWSAPVEVADAEVDAFFGEVWGAVRIASDGREHVLVTWPVKDGVEARWLRVPQD